MLPMNWQYKFTWSSDLKLRQTTCDFRMRGPKDERIEARYCFCDRELLHAESEWKPQYFEQRHLYNAARWFLREGIVAVPTDSAPWARWPQS
jgi:hypothetical protein